MRSYDTLIFSMLVILSILAPIDSPAQTASRQTKKPMSQAKRKPEPNPEFVADGNKLTLTLDKSGSSMWFQYQYPDPTPAYISQQIWLNGGFKTSKGCNSWFGEAATFILDESNTISVPWPAQCPLPPRFRALPLWMVESISRASVVKLQLDGLTYSITTPQLAALRQFVDKYSPDASWRTTHEPYAVPNAHATADGLASTLLHPYNGYFLDKRDSATFEWTWPVGHPQTVQETLRWADLVPSYSGVACEDGVDCVEESSTYLSDGNKSLEHKSLDWVTGAEPPFNMGERLKAWDLDRAIAFLWYKHTFLNVTASGQGPKS